MNTIKINFSNFTALPAGCYEVIVKKVIVKKSKTSINKYLRWELETTQNPSAGKKLFLITSLKENSLWRLKKLLDIIKYPYNDELTELNLDELKGHKLKVTVEARTTNFSDKKYNEVIDFEGVK